MTDSEIYEILCKKAQNIKMHMLPSDVTEIAERFRRLSTADVVSREEHEELKEQIDELRAVNERLVKIIRENTWGCVEE